jgi:cytidine deaminase
MAIKIIKKSLDLSYNLFPECYEKSGEGRRPYHFAFLFKKGRLISFGINSYQKSAKIFHLGRRFNITKYSEYQLPHAETDAISKAWGKIHLDNSCTMTIIRLNRHGFLQDSKPCVDCQAILSSLGITKVWWSTKLSTITNGKLVLTLDDLKGKYGEEGFKKAT